MQSACHEMGCKIGQDFQIVGFDDIEQARQVCPTLTTVSCNIAAIGVQAARTVIDWIENANPPQPRPAGRSN